MTEERKYEFIICEVCHEGCMLYKSPHNMCNEKEKQCTRCLFRCKKCNGKGYISWLDHLSN